MRMMRRPTVWTNNLVALLLGAGMYGMFAFLPQFVQTPPSSGYGFGASITLSGTMMLPSTITMFVVGSFAGRLGQWIGGKTLVIVGCLLGSVALAMFAFAHEQEWQIYLANAIIGVGFGLAFAAMSNLVVVAVPVEQTGVASGMNANIRTIGGSIGAAVMASIVTSDLQPSGFPVEAGYTAGFAVLAAALALGAVAGLLIPSTARRSVSPDELPHAELAVLAAGSVVGDEPE
jgi:predicted MFS family arabinose efflux permease